MRDRPKIYEIGKLTAIRKAISCRRASHQPILALFLSREFFKREKITYNSRAVPLSHTIAREFINLVRAERNRPQRPEEIFQFETGNFLVTPRVKSLRYCDSQKNCGG